MAVLPTQIAEDLVLGTGVYVVANGTTIMPGRRLQVSAGSVFKFQPGASLNINDGSVVIEGSSQMPVVFTALSDDSYGGYSNGDRPSEGTAGAWAGVIANGSNADLKLRGVIIRYANTGISFSGKNLQVEQSRIQFSAQNALDISQ